MAESILTNINLANGAINIYYDTILGILRWQGNGSDINTYTQCPSGWKCAYVVNANAYNYTGSSSASKLLIPIIVFNHRTSDMFTYYGQFIDDTRETYMNAVISINNIQFKGCPSYSNQTSTYTVIFAA